MLIDNNFKQWVEVLSQNYKRAQIKAAIHVNSELINFYLNLGKEISETSYKAMYGNSFYNKLSFELRSRLKDVKGLSPVNIRYCERVYTLYKKILPQVVEKLVMIPWGHHRTIIDKCKNIESAMFYINYTLKNNFSRSQLELSIDSFAYERSKDTLNNFEATLPDQEKKLTVDLIKDPYKFDFLELREDYDEKELKNELESNIKSFLLELGTGFAFMGSEYRLLAGDTELFADMLFYHTKLHCYVVIEVKTDKFKPEYMGQLAGYVGTIDGTMKTEQDGKTIGLLLCKSKDNVLAKYTLNNAAFPIGISEFELANLIPEKYKNKMPTIDEIEGKNWSIKKKKTKVCFRILFWIEKGGKYGNH